MALPRPVPPPVTSAISFVRSNGFIRNSGACVSRRLRFDLFKTWREEVIQDKGDDVGRRANRKKDGVAVRDVASSLKTIEQFTNQNREKESAQRTSGATQSDDRSNGRFREHVGNGGEQIG